MGKKKLSKEQQIEHEENYVEYLKKMLKSENYKSSVTKEEYKKTELKYSKAKLKLKFLKES